MRITSFGAAGGVTGSNHLVETDQTRFLVDCGLFQGEEEEKNWASFPYEPRAVSFLLLTHSHLDHCGRLPKLVREGFRGPVVATAATRDTARLILLDAAHLQHEEFLTQQRKHRRSGLPVRQPLFSVEDVLRTIDLFEPRVRYGEPFGVMPGVRASFRDAGHVLGSAFIELEIEEGGATRRITFSGDLGSAGQSHVVSEPTLPRECDLMVVESTYGDRSHRPVEESVAELAEAVNHTVERKGNVIIPTFALERAQDILFHLGQLQRAKTIPECAIYLDSPLAIDITGVYRRYPECLAPQLRETLDSGGRPFLFSGAHFTRAVEESKQLDNLRGVIIIAGSGMCTGGRILHHLRHHLWQEECSIVIVGYQARKTLGRALVEGAERVRIYGEEIVVRAKVHTINGFSAHADQPGLLRWLTPCRGTRAHLVHGEDHALAALQKITHDHLGMASAIARFGEPVEV